MNLIINLEEKAIIMLHTYILVHAIITSWWHYYVMYSDDSKAGKDKAQKMICFAIQWS